MGSYGVPLTGGGNGMYAEDGVIKNYLTHPGYKNLAIYLNKLWEQGLISSEAFTQDWSKYTSTSKGDGDVARVGVTWMWTPSDIFGSKLADQYITIPSLKVEDSEKEPVWCFNGDSGNYGANRITVSATVGNKEAALKLVDAFYTADISVQARFGAFDLAVKKNGEKDYTVLEPEDESKNSSDWQFQNSLADGAPGWVVQPGVTITLPKEHVEVRGVDAVYEDDWANMDLNTDVIYGGVSFTAEENQQYSLNETGLGQYAMSTFAKWVTKGGADTEWDSYLAELEKNNLPDQIATQQAAYDRYLTVLADADTDLNKELAGEGYEYVENEDGTGTITNTN
jgi:putative aldouronate transport system substrate-binding protein